MKKLMSIEGMSCMNCVRHVEEALREINGVGSINVDLRGKSALVDVTESVTDISLKKAVEEAGYDVKGINLV